MRLVVVCICIARETNMFENDGRPVHCVSHNAVYSTNDPFRPIRRSPRNLAHHGHSNEKEETRVSYICIERKIGFYGSIVVSKIIFCFSVPRV